MKKVLIPTKLDSISAKILTDNGNYQVVQDAQTPIADLIAANPDTYALIVRSEVVDAAMIDALPQLKVIIRAGAGYNTIDIKYARKRGVDVMNTPGANANAVAEEVIALILADMRHIVAADPSVRSGKWEKKLFMGTELSGKTVGIVGLGYIGRLVAKRLRGFDCRILGYDPLVPSEKVRAAGIEPVSLEELFSEADIVTLHIPETDSTRKMLSTELLSHMKTGAMIVNCARAGIVDEDALRAAKPVKKLHYITDVYPKDAEGPKSIADVADVMMPHLGASTKEANYTAAKRAAEELIELDERGLTSCIVNRDIPDGLDRSYCDLAYTIARLTRLLAGVQAPIREIETSFYGQLEPFGNWLIVPVLAGLCDGFDRLNDHKSAVNYLKESGIAYTNRQIPEDKNYTNSMTVDIMVEKSPNELKRISVRGTVAEAHLMVARINEFDGLYFEPNGAILCCIYEDRPGVIAAISRRIADKGINIEDMRNPHDAKTGRSLVIVKLSETIDDETLTALKDEIQAEAALCLSL